jgi:hypothetical protein
LTERLQAFLEGGNRPLRDYDYPYLNQPSDVSEEFARQENHFFVAMGLDEFDPESATGTRDWTESSTPRRSG